MDINTDIHFVCNSFVQSCSKYDRLELNIALEIFYKQLLI